MHIQVERQAEKTHRNPKVQHRRPRNSMIPGFEALEGTVKIPIGLVGWFEGWSLPLRIACIYIRYFGTRSFFCFVAGQERRAG